MKSVRCLKGGEKGADSFQNVGTRNDAIPSANITGGGEGCWNTKPEHPSEKNAPNKG